MTEYAQNVLILPAGAVPDGTPILGANGQFYFAVPRSQVGTDSLLGVLANVSSSVRPVTDYSRNVLLAPSGMPLVCLMRRPEIDQALSDVDPNGQWMYLGWQFHAN